MKKILLISGLCCILAGGAFAQKNPFFTIGPKIGINHSNILFDKSSPGKDGIQGYQAGAFMRLGILKTYIQPEAYYNFKSTSIAIDDGSGTTQFAGHIKFNQIDVPVLLGSKIVNAKIFNIRIFAGPMVSFLLKDENSIKNYDLNNYDFNNKIWGGQAGLGFDVGNVTVDLRYQTKLSRINKMISGPESMLHLSAGIKLF